MIGAGELAFESLLESEERTKMSVQQFVKGGIDLKRGMFSMVAVIAVTMCFLIGAPTSFCQQNVGVIVVDVQGDFTTWKNGSLAVPGTDKAFVDKVQAATESLKKKGHPVIATQDWHPKDHVSFCTNHEGKKPFETTSIDGKTQVLWPAHCVQGTDNAGCLLDKNLFVAVVQKGRDKKFDSYSGFQDDGGTKTGLDEMLKKNSIKELIVYGIATDYCVKATAIDAANAGYKVTVIEDLCRGVAPETTTVALKEMAEKGVAVKKSLEP